MSRRLDWDKAKADQLKGLPGEPVDMDMLSEPEHQEWWRGKNRKQRATSKEALQKKMAEAFGRGRTVVPERPKEVVAALISPKIKALLAEVASAAGRREQRFSQLVRAKAGPKRRKPRG